MNKWLPVVLAGLLLITASCQKGSENQENGLKNQMKNISRLRMESVMEFLSDDLLEGRSPGTRGGLLAEKYLKSLFKFMNLQPGNGNSYYQPFPLKGITTSDLQLTTENCQLKGTADVVGVGTGEEGPFEVTGETVFIGFGITTGQWNWDDYKETDIRGKIVITRVNDPGLFIPEIFEGETLTYYGRWTYHIEEAARRGARGILLIHTDRTAGYNWKVVQNSWSGEEVFIESDLDNDLEFRGWIREKSLKRLLARSPHDLGQLYRKSLNRDFQPVELGFPLTIRGQNTRRTFLNRNVVGRIPGQSSRRIVLSAHLDHLGTGDPDKGDRIYNGAIDNGSAVGAMMAAASVLKKCQSSLHYSVTILACNSEEAGLLGSRYYARNTDLSSIIANINFESTPVWKSSTSLMGIGARFSTFEDLIRDIAREEGIGYTEFSLSGQGLFYRSDQFSFARYGVPSVWISAGEKEIDGERNYTEFWHRDYHTVRDEYHGDWNLGGMKQTIRAALQLVDRINQNRRPPRWKDNLTFPRSTPSSARWP